MSTISEGQENAKPQGLFGELRPEQTPTVNFTVIRSDRLLSKRFGVDAGAPVKLSRDATLVSGVAGRRTLTGSADQMASQLARDLEQMGSSNALILAPPPDGKARWDIVTDREVGERKDVISRTNRFFVPRPGLSLAGLDHDVRDFPDFIRARLVGDGTASIRDALVQAIGAVAPETLLAASVSRYSMSAGIRVKSTGIETDPGGGLHRFMIVDDGQRIDTFMAVLSARLMLNGWLWGLITENGSILARTLFDLGASKDAGRLWYEGKPVLEDDDLEFLQVRRAAHVSPGGVLDTSAMQPLETAEQTRLDEMLMEMRRKLQPEADDRHRRWAEKMKSRVPPAVSPYQLPKALKAAVEKKEISGSFPIQLDDGRVVTAREILAGGVKFDGLTCADPVEWDYNGGKNIAIIYADGQRPRIVSQAHGGTTYRVELAVEDVFEPVDEEQAAAEEDSRSQDPRDVFGDGDASTILEVPAGAFPDVIDRWSTDVSDRIGTTKAFAGVSALAVMAAAIGAKLWVQPKQFDSAWREPTFLWFGLVEEPGGKKSPTIAQAVGPLMSLDAQKAKEGQARWAQWEERKRQAKRSQPPFMEPEPKVQRHVTDGFTIEALGAILADNPHGLLVIADELAGLIGSMDQYKSGRGTDRQMLLRLLDGREARIDRVSRKNVFIPCWGAGVLGGIQPAKIKAMAKDLDADGLLQRFILVRGDGERRPGIDRAPDLEAVESYEAAIRQLAQVEFQSPTPVITLSPEAHTIWRSLNERVSKLAAVPGLSDAWAAHIGKWPGFAARLLLVCHVLENLGDRLGQIGQTSISAETAGRTVKLVEWLLVNSLRFYTDIIGVGEVAEDAKWIAGFILGRAKAGTITRRDICQARAEYREKPERVEQAMRFLGVAGWCEPAESKDNRHGPAWTICPKVHDGRFASRAESERIRRDRERRKIGEAVAERRNLLSGGGDAS